MLSLLWLYCLYCSSVSQPQSDFIRYKNTFKKLFVTLLNFFHTHESVISRTLHSFAEVLLSSAQGSNRVRNQRQSWAGACRIEKAAATSAIIVRFFSDMYRVKGVLSTTVPTLMSARTSS